MRRISENGFGILANRWRVFRRPFSLEPEKVKVIIISYCIYTMYIIFTINLYMYRYMKTKNIYIHIHTYITLAATTLHNWLRKDTSYGKVYIPNTLSDYEDTATRQIIEGSRRNDHPPPPPIPNHGNEFLLQKLIILQITQLLGVVLQNRIGDNFSK